MILCSPSPCVGVIAWLGLLIADKIHDLVLPLTRRLVSRQDHLKYIQVNIEII